MTTYTLSIDSRNVCGSARRLPVTATLTDADGVPVAGHVSGQSIVTEFKGFTNEAGLLALPLTDNASITPANTYYTVTVGRFSFLISKAASTQTLLAALAASPSDLVPAFSPGTAADWPDPAPTTAQAALDDLAEALPTSVLIPALLPESDSSGFTRATALGVAYWTSTAQNAYVEWQNLSIRLPNSYVRVDVLAQRSNASGIITIKLDGTTVGTIDLYDAAGDIAIQSYDHIALDTGLHTLRLTMATKNASSSGYECPALSQVVLSSTTAGGG